MSEPKGEIDPRSNYDVRYQAMTMAIEALGRDRQGCELIEIAVAIEGYLLGDNSRLAPESPEQPSYKHPESETFNLSEGMLSKGEDTKLPDSPTEETIQAAVSEITPSAPEDIETLRGSDPITPMADLSPSQQDNYFDGLPNGQAQEQLYPPA